MSLSSFEDRHVNRSPISRRAVLKGAAASAASLITMDVAARKETRNPVKVAAIQMHASLGDVNQNLASAASWVRKAIKEGAKWIVLPEFFTSGLAFHPSMMDAHRPVNGEPAEMLKGLAKEGKAAVGGSFLASSRGNVYNTFVLAMPDGQIYSHDKDFPSCSGESFCYAGGEDAEYLDILRRHGSKTIDEAIPPREENIKDGVFRLPGGNVGVALCWENIRYRTVERLLAGRVEMLLAASGWPVVDPRVGIPNVPEPLLESGKANWIDMIRETPVKMAKLLGVPVVHANLVGDTEALSFPDGESRVLLQFLGESRIVDADGTVLASRKGADGEGLVVHEITPRRITPTLSVRDCFWIPDDRPLIDAWWYNAEGRDYYITTTRPHRNRNTLAH